MPQFETKLDQSGAVVGLQTALRGRALLKCSALNKGNSFTIEEREALGLQGLMPDNLQTLDEQIDRSYQQYQQCSTALQKNVYLNALFDRNEVLFYSLMTQHLVDMLPIVYTPTVGDAVQQFSLQLRQPRGLFFSYPRRLEMDSLLDNYDLADIDLIVATDGEGVLGIGDQGVGGMDISIAKLMVYTLCGGIDPNRVLPIQLDVGTNNQKLLDDPLYLGWRHKRLSGAEYDDFIESFVSAVRKRLPRVYLHWEDFGRENARRILSRYREQMTTFNDDMQGTGATVLACVLSAVRQTGRSLVDQRIVLFGAGTAGMGILDQICDAMCLEGAALSQAHQQCWCIDRNGLLTEHSDDIQDFQQPYVRTKAEIEAWSVSADHIDLEEVVKQVKPTLLIGCSTVGGAFSETIIKEMHRHVSQPIILALSNPTDHSEAIPEDVMRWTNGKALMATGSPFAPVTVNGREIPISQANNAYVFPGLGLGVIASQATRVTDRMLYVAAHTLSTVGSDSGGAAHPVLLPPLDQVPEVSQEIAIQVAKCAVEEGVAARVESDWKEIVSALFWDPVYHPVSPIEMQ